jgi:hypothetical protein
VVSVEHGILAYDPETVRAAESWLDGQFDLVTTTYTAGQWGVLGITWNGEPRRETLRETFGETDRRLVTAFEFGGEPGHPDAGPADYGPAARGEFDEQWRRTARELVEVGMEDTVLRLNHEFNLDWSSKYPSDPETYARAFARCVREMRSVDGADFTFCFAPARNELGVAPEAWPAGGPGIDRDPVPEWPGDAEQPLVTPTVYDTHWTYPDRTAEVTDADRREGWETVRGLVRTWEEFAAARGADLGTAEWGVASQGYPPNSGGDNPYYIEQFLEYVEANDWRFQAYWNDQSPRGGGHEIFPRDARGLTAASDRFQSIVSDRLDGGGGGGDGDDPAREHTLTVEAARGAPDTTYSIVVSGDARREAEVEGNDEIRDNGDGTTTVAGVVANLGVDVFAFDGEVLPGRSSVDGPATAYVDGSAVDLDGDGGGDGGGRYARPDRGTDAWHQPVNDTFATIGDDVSALADRLAAVDGGDGAAAYGGYARPDRGTADWQRPLNENFAAIEADVGALADRVAAIDGGDGAAAYGGYARPDRGTADWNGPLNDNFAAIEADVDELRGRIAAVEDARDDGGDGGGGGGGGYPGREALPDPLGVDAASPMVYTNDQSPDNYNGELALAMASDGTVDLRGFVNEYPPEPWFGQGHSEYRSRKSSYVSNHREVRQRAAESGFTDLPPAELGLYRRHERPASGAVDDTEPVGSAGTDRIVEAARAASPDRPLVVACGGSVCTVADAYLTDPSIADSLVVFLRIGSDLSAPGYNVNNSGWSYRVVLERLSTVLMPSNRPPHVTRERVQSLPDEPLREYMLTKQHYKYDNPVGDGETWDGDSIATLSPAHPETRASSRHLAITGSQPNPWDGIAADIPTVSRAGDGHIAVVSENTGMTDAFWDHVADDGAWG